MLYGVTFDSKQEYIKNKQLASNIENIIAYKLGDLPQDKNKIEKINRNDIAEWKKSVKNIVSMSKKIGIVDISIEIVKTISQGIKILIKSEQCYDKQQLKTLEEQTKNRGFNFEDVVDGSFVTNDMVEIYDQLIKTAEMYTQVNQYIDQNTIDIICESKHVTIDTIIESFATDSALKY